MAKWKVKKSAFSYFFIMQNQFLITQFSILRLNSTTGRMKRTLKCHNFILFHPLFSPQIFFCVSNKYNSFSHRSFFFSHFSLRVLISLQQPFHHFHRISNFFFRRIFFSIHIKSGSIWMIERSKRIRIMKNASSISSGLLLLAFIFRIIH